MAILVELGEKMETFFFLIEHEEIYNSTYVSWLSII